MFGLDLRDEMQRDGRLRAEARGQHVIAGQILERPLDALVGLQRGELAVAMLERVLAARFLVVGFRVESGRRFASVGSASAAATSCSAAFIRRTLKAKCGAEASVLALVFERLR